MPVAKFPPEEYSYYTTSEDEKPPPKPKPKAMPKEDGKKRKMPVAATPKKVAKARGRPKKKKAPSPSPSPTPTPSEESLDNGDIQEEEAEEEEEVSPSEMSEVFEAEGAAAVPSSKKEKKKHTRLVDDEEEMSRLMEESRRLVEAQRQIEMERAQLRAELRAKRAKKKAEEEAKKEEIRRQEEEDKKLAKKEAKDKENAEKKRLRDQAAEELKKEDESRIAEFRKNQTGYSREFFKSLENPDDPAQRKEFLRLHNEKVAAYQRSLKAQKLKEDLEEMKNKPPGQRLQEQRKIPVETDPWSRPAEFWNQSWKAVTAASLSKGYFHCGSQSCKKSFDNETAYWQHLYSKSGKPGHPSGEIFANWKRGSAGEPYVPLVMDPNWESGLQEEKKQAELKAKMAEALQSVSSEDESSESSNDTQESHTVHVTQAVFEDVRSAEGVPAEKVSEEDQKEKEFDPKVTVTFELPHNNRYWKLCEIREFRNRYGLDFEGIVSCCRTGLRAVRTGRLIGKRYRVVSNSESTSKVLNAKFAKCTCTEEHAAFNEVDWKQTEGYTRRFATVLIRTVLAFRFTAET